MGGNETRMRFPVSWLGFSLLGTALVACYSLQPLRGAEPEVGNRIAFDLNDSGRVVLGGTMGPEIAQVEGQLLNKDSTGYLLAVSTIRLLRGGEQVWAGEQVRLDSRYLGSGYARRFSVGRSIGLGAVAVGGIAAFVAGFSWVTGGADPTPSPGDTAQTSTGRP
jgi:hypothetical protein